jgi:hypothetical protein
MEKPMKGEDSVLDIPRVAGSQRLARGNASGDGEIA